jgi:hypothetical protein
MTVLQLYYLVEAAMGMPSAIAAHPCGVAVPGAEGIEEHPDQPEWRRTSTRRCEGEARPAIIGISSSTC